MLETVLILVLVFEVVSFFAIRFLLQGKSSAFQKWSWLAYWAWTVLVTLVFLVAFFFQNRFADPSFMNTAFVLLSLVVINLLFKALLALFFGLNTVVNGIAKLLKVNKIKHTDTGRRKFITQTGLALGSFAMGTMLYGILRGRYQFRVIKQTIALHNLPESFIGKTIVHLSDMHLGSFPQGSSAVSHAVDQINELQADYIFFTGDMINERAIEAEPWVSTIGKLRAKYGKYSSLGNHDYGDYYEPWVGNPQKIEENVQHLASLQQEMGFQLLRNENIKLQQGNEYIRLIGLENWGAGRFSKYGDIAKATEGITDDEVQILLSHDPSHWDEHVLKDYPAIDLALAGHTHGSQLGVEFPSFRWSPAQYIYKRWAGLYQEAKQQLYVNRGFGYIGYAGRVGIWPEITLIELRKA